MNTLRNGVVCSLWAQAILGRYSKYLYPWCDMIPDSTPVCMHCPTIDIMPTCPIILAGEGRNRK